MSAGNLLGTAVLELRVDDNQLAAGIEGAKQRVEGLRGSLTSAGQSMMETGRSMTVVSAGALAMGAAALKVGIDYESAFAGVRKTVNASEAEFEALSAGIRQMALEVPASATSIASVAEAAGQLGIETPNILGFTRTMIDLGVATNLSAEDAASSLARLANITQMPQTEFGRLGSVVVALGNNFATTESEIVAMGLRIAGAGHTVGMTEPQIMSFGAALSSVGIEAEAGGSAMSRVMIQMASDVQSGGEKLELFAQVAGMSGEEFQRAFKEDAAGAIVSFIEGLGGIQAAGGDVFGTLEALGLSEIRVRDALLRAAGAGDLFRNAMELGNTAWQENTALTNEAAQRYATTASQLQILKNHVVEIGISLGATLLPMLNQGVEALQRFAGFISGSVVPAFNALPEGVKVATVVFAGLIAVAGPLLVVFGALTVAIAGISPVVLAVVAGAAALIAILVAIESETGLVSAAWDGLKWVFENAVGGVQKLLDVLGRIPDTIKRVLQTIALGGDAISRLFRGDIIGATDSAKAALDLWRDASNEWASGVEGAAQRVGGAVTTASEQSKAAAKTYREQVEADYAAVQDAREKDRKAWEADMAERKAKTEDAETTVIWHASDRSMMLSRDKLSKAMEQVLEQASKDLGTKVTQKDLELGFVNIWDKELGARSVNLQRYVDLVGEVAERTAAAGGAAKTASSDYRDLGDGLHYTQGEVDALLARTTTIVTGIGMMGESALGAMETIAQAVESGTISAGQAIDGFVSSGQISFGEFRAAGEAEMAKLQAALTKAFAEGDFETADALQQRIDTLSRIMDAGSQRALEFGDNLSRVSDAYAAILSPAAEASANMSEWENRAKLATQAGEILDQQLAAGSITQEDYNQKKAQLNWLSERAAGALTDEGGAIVDAGVKTAEYTQKLDDLNSKYADKNSSEYRLALAALTAQYDPASAAGLTMADSLGNLATAMDTTIERIVNLLVQLGIFDQTQAEAVLGVDASQAEQGTDSAKGKADEFSNSDYEAALTADNQQAIDKAHDAWQRSREYADSDYTAALKADESNAVAGAVNAKGEAVAYAGGLYQAAILADNSNALAGIAEVSDAIAGVTRSFTVYAELDYTAVTAGLVRVEGLLPHSPAKWGPLAFTPDWSWLTAGFSADTLPAVESGVSTAAGLLAMDGQPLGRGVGAGYAAGLTDSAPAVTAAAVGVSESASEGVVLGMADARRFQGESFLRELDAFSSFVIAMVADSAGQFESGMLDAAKGYMDAAKSAFELFEQALTLIGALDASNASLQHAVQAATDLKVLTEHIVLSIGDSVALIDASRPEGFVSRAVEYADAAKSGVDLMQAGVDLLAALDGAAINLGAAKDAASAIKFLTEHVTLSIGDSARYLDATRGEGFVAAATAYAEAARKGLDLMEQGAALMATLSGLSSDLDRAKDGASDVKFLTEHIILSIGDSADYIAATRGGGFVERARVYAEAATAGMELMGTAADVLASLGTLAAVNFTQASEAASNVKFLTEHLVQSLGDSAALFSEGGLTHLKVYLDAATAALGLMGQITPALSAMLDFGRALDTGVDLRARADEMVALTQMVVAQMQTAASAFSSSGLAAVSEYADSANAAMETMGKAGDALEAILMFATINTTGRDLAGIAQGMVDLINLIVRQLEAVAVHWQTDGLEAVSAFSASASAGLEVMGTAGEALKAILLYGDLDPATRDNLRQLAWEMTGVADYILDMLRQISQNYSADALGYLGTFAKVAGDLLGLVKTAADAFKAMVDHSRVTQQHADAFLASWEIVIDLVQRVAELASTQGVQDALRFLSAVEEIAAIMQAANATIAAVQPAALPSTSGTTTAPSTGATTSNTTTTLPPASGTSGGNYGDPGGWNPAPVGTESTITRAAKGIELPKLALGGVVTRELAATVGDGGTEAVIPLEDAGAGIVAKAMVAEMLRSPEWLRLDRMPLGSFSADLAAFQRSGDEIEINFNSPVTINARDREDATRAVEDIGWGVRAAKRRRGLAV